MTEKQILKSKIFSPGLIGGQVVRFLTANKGFFLKHENTDDYVRDDKGCYVKMSIENVVEARKSYLTLYEDKEKSERVQQEIVRLKADIKSKAEKVISEITKWEKMKIGDYGSNFSKIIMSNYVMQDERSRDVARAEIFFEKMPKALELRDELNGLIEKEDYNKLHNMFQCNSIVPLATFKTDRDADLTALITVFGAENINQSIDILKNDELALIAKINVEKVYYPNL